MQRKIYCVICCLLRSGLVKFICGRKKVQRVVSHGEVGAGIDEKGLEGTF